MGVGQRPRNESWFGSSGSGKFAVRGFRERVASGCHYTRVRGRITLAEGWGGPECACWKRRGGAWKEGGDQDGRTQRLYTAWSGPYPAPSDSLPRLRVSSSSFHHR